MENHGAKACMRPFLWVTLLSINDNLNNMDNLENKKSKKKNKKVAVKVDGGGEKEHKEPWQKVYAKAEEIEQFLNDHRPP